MNPVEWLKTIYGWIGAAHPKSSLVVVTILGAVAAFAFWNLAGYLYSRDRALAKTTTPASQVNTTSGNLSPILTNNSGNVTITNQNQSASPGSSKDKQK